MIETNPVIGAGREISVPSPALVERKAADLARVREIPRVYASCLVLFVILSRWLVAPAYLYYFDSANFALALEEFNPALHQPQPPGYPFFVALTRVIHFFMSDAQQVMLVAGLVGGIAALIVLYHLAAAMFDRNAGILASALLASDPVFWFGGVTNEIRVFLALGMASICLAAWKALEAPGRTARLYILFGVIGLAAGFRPVEMWLLVPLALWVWWRSSGSAATLFRAGLVLAAATLPWLGFVVWRAGGPRVFAEILAGYTTSQFQDSSALFGARAGAAGNMFLKAVTWTAMGSAVWIWALPFIRLRPDHANQARKRFLFVAIALLPTFLFAALIHVGDPDQTLAGVTLLSLIGGAVMGRLLNACSMARVYTAAALLTVAHASDFYHPRFHLGEMASYGFVRTIDRLTTENIQAIASLQQHGQATIIHGGSPLSFRQIAYYFPDQYVVALGTQPGESSFTFFRHRQVPAPKEAAAWIGPETRQLIYLPPRGFSADGLPGWRRIGPVFVLDAVPQDRVRIGGQTLIWYQ